MTLIVGILCEGGVVMASDSAATYATLGGQQTIGQQGTTKVRQLGSSPILFSATGSVGTSQILSEAIQKLWDDKQLRGTGPTVMGRIGQEISAQLKPLFGNAADAAKLVGQGFCYNQMVCACLVAMPVGHHPYLFQFNPWGHPEHATKDLPFVALGSGQDLADPFLAFLKRVLWQGQRPTLAQGRFAAAWTIDHVVRTNPGGVGGDTQMWTLTCDGKSDACVAKDSDIGDHVKAAESALRDYFEKGGPTTPPPKPPTE